MPKFYVTVEETFTATVEIEAEDEESAREQAGEMAEERALEYDCEREFTVRRA